MVKHWSVPVREALQADGVRIAELDTSARPGFDGDKKLGEALLLERGRVLSELQEKLYANGRSGDSRSVLLVLQGMDTAGKGGIVRHVIGSVDPQGVDHAAFGVPTEEEKRHHYLWRIRKELPRGGQIGVFDRSHYEDVLVVRVHNLVPATVWGERYDEINAFERELTDEGITLVKVAMFVSLEEQKKRLRQRLERPDKYWKFNPSDIDERAFWPAYQDAYQAILDRTSTEHAPWFVLPADHKWYSRLAVTELLIAALQDLGLDWPPPHFDVAEQLARLEQA
ncbi:polyphosphate kinase 2 family protein [Nocardia cyriacigeorgica]|uniref:Polyphosphate kinase 2 family protein n=2 Tax=Nocardia cyriacigeorgica TaxID=135487 RepID=A0A6P1CWT8_9NOCA|nr:polyphosphate kinase 2 family protein [Nocardia cyriacigeorgica]MBF6082244.1 polyphosphate kinase 2 family protein [Nocardia cyriacigeorgica]MBF6285168.1 polyphosphate kinase 2 family protein [Nocardia cyriacigeorgica]MBF6426377.1 polyphosphate kinase 2 family protein [Nocardia cyriacigeorgica]NEW35866.1 polyphosphate kinase 2 family protein [Nocardia cyriacigeorgica]CCF65777.1 Putative Polyphosphate kinase 2 superfamily protein [Nocardia cyriacigeorgica GUH-2]